MVDYPPTATSVFPGYKLSGQLNQTNKLIAFWHRYGDHEKAIGEPVRTERAMEQNNAWGETWKAEWQATIGQSLTLSVQHGRFEHVNQHGVWLRLEWSRHHHVDGRWRRGVGWPI